MKKSLGQAPKFGEAINKYCFDNKMTQKKLFEEGARLYMNKN